MTRVGEKSVTLVSGEVVSNYSDLWRHECEARAVLQMPNRAARRAYLDKVGKIRGRDAMLALEATGRALWELEKEKLSGAAA